MPRPPRIRLPPGWRTASTIALQTGDAAWEDTPQVRKSLYDASLAQWRHYATQLETLRAQLLAAGLEVES